jgi:membrane protein YqaA with SNARE-associated domain
MAVVIPIPYTIVIFTLAGTPGWDPLLLTIAGGTGSAIGELVGYFLGYYGRRLISLDRLRRMDYLLRIFGKYSPLAIFLFALTPLPDDLLFIPLGLMRYSIVKAFIPALLGKLLMIYAVAYFGKIGSDIILGIFGESSIYASVVTMALLIIVVALLYRINWEKVFDRYFNRNPSSNLEEAYQQDEVEKDSDSTPEREGREGGSS